MTGGAIGRAAVPSGASTGEHEAIVDEETFARVQEQLARNGRSGGRAVRVNKRRRRYTIEGCLAELADVEADGRRFVLTGILPKNEFQAKAA